MTPDEANIFESVFKILVGILITIFGWIGNKAMAAIKKNEESIFETTRQLDAHKLHVSDNYVKNTVLERINDNINDIQKDIKIIIGKLGNGGK